MDFDETYQALANLALRARGDAGHKPDLSAAVGVVDDVGRALAASNPAELSRIQAAIAALREQLEYAPCGVAQSPNEGLRGENNHAFLAGAMWATNDLVASFMSQRAGAPEAFSASRAALRSAILTYLKSHEVGTPSDFASWSRGGNEESEVRRDQVSRALGDLINEGLVKAAPSPAGTDRRNRFYHLTGIPHDPNRWTETFEVAKSAVATVWHSLGSWARTQEAFDSAVMECQREQGEGALIHC